MKNSIFKFLATTSTFCLQTNVAQLPVSLRILRYIPIMFKHLGVQKEILIDFFHKVEKFFSRRACHCVTNPIISQSFISIGEESLGTSDFLATIDHFRRYSQIAFLVHKTILFMI